MQNQANNNKNDGIYTNICTHKQNQKSPKKKVQEIDHQKLYQPVQKQQQNKLTKVQRKFNGVKIVFINTFC